MFIERHVAVSNDCGIKATARCEKEIEISPLAARMHIEMKRRAERTRREGVCACVDSGLTARRRDIERHTHTQRDRRNGKAIDSLPPGVTPSTSSVPTKPLSPSDGWFRFGTGRNQENGRVILKRESH